MKTLLKEFNKIYLEINGEKIDQDIKSYLKCFFADEIPYMDFINEYHLDASNYSEVVEFALNVSNFDQFQRFGYKYHKKED